VVDTSGAYIPGHGTPTVILFGRAQLPMSDHIWAVLGKRGEPKKPKEGEEEGGLVWAAIVSCGSQPQDMSPFVSVASVRRATFEAHPWSLGGGLSADTKSNIESNASGSMCERVVLPIGRAVRIGQDDAYMMSLDEANRFDTRGIHLRGLLLGENVRDYEATTPIHVFYPYEAGSLRRVNACDPEWAGPFRHYWRFRVALDSRATFQGTMRNAGLEWFEYMQHTASAYRTPLSITFAEVATHNHFVFDRGGKVFKQTAPVIKLPAAATEDDHLDLIGLLNSSALGFWMKQVIHRQGGSGVRARHPAEDWERFYEYDATKLQPPPLRRPPRPRRPRSALDATAQSRAACLPAAVLASGDWTPDLSRASSPKPASTTPASPTSWSHCKRSSTGSPTAPMACSGVDPVETVGPDAIEPLAPATAPSRSSSPAPTTRPIPTRSPPGGRATATTE
jgi:hypothetical protein